jgi:hypothetical protein
VLVKIIGEEGQAACLPTFNLGQASCLSLREYRALHNYGSPSYPLV